MKTEKDPRHQARRLALSVIYSVENSDSNNYNDDFSILIESVEEDLEIKKYDEFLFGNIIKGVSENRDELRQSITDNSLDWEINKIYKLDLSILMIAIYEIKHTDIPMKVAIDEAVELGKEFGDKDTPKFINGILAGVVKNEPQKS